METGASSQGFVSRYLTHFVGRWLQSDEDKYRLLLEIVRSGKLIAPGKSDIQMASLEPGGPEGWILRRTRRVDYTKALSQNEKYLSSVICFCDIPEKDIEFHSRKYSSFGLSFQKEFLIQQGATPVFYIVRESATHEASGPGTQGREAKRTRADVFDHAEMDYCRRVTGIYPKPTSAAAERASAPFGRLMEEYVFPFMKFFDGGRRDDDPENFYMEREWRLIGVATFSLADIACLYVSPEFVDRVVEDSGIARSHVRVCGSQ